MYSVVKCSRDLTIKWRLECRTIFSSIGKMHTFHLFVTNIKPVVANSTSYAADKWLSESRKCKPNVR